MTDSAAGPAPLPSPEAVTIVVPVYNEEACIDEFYARVEGLGYARSLVFVDNASTDGTLARLERYGGLRVIHHARNEGYGASIVDGIAASSADYIVIIDADLEYPPEAIPALLGALHDDPAVYGSRFLSRTPPDMPRFRRAGNRLISSMYNLLFRQHTTDCCTGLKGLRRSAFPLHTLRQRGFEHVMELGAMIALAGRKIHDIPVAYAPRSRGASKMRHLPEALKFTGYAIGYWWWCTVRGRPLSAFPARSR